MELEESTFRTSDYTTKLQSSDSMVLAQKEKYRPTEQERESLKINPGLMDNLFLTKETRIYNGAQIASSISGAGKTGHLHVKTK